MRLLLTGDTHLGKGVHLYDGRLADQERAWADTLAVARDRGCDAVLHAGDLFDSRRPSPDVLVAAERPLMEHAAAKGFRCPVHVIAGNHDIPSLTGACGLDVLHEAGLIVSHRQPETETMQPLTSRQGRPVDVAFLPWAPVGRLVAELTIDDRDEVFALAGDVLVRAVADLADTLRHPAILVAHWSVSGAQLPSGLPVEHVREVILDRLALEAQGWRAIVLGHIHRPGNVAGSPVAFYTGSPITLDHGEANVPHGVLVYDVDADTLERVELDAPRFVTATFEGTPDGSYAVSGADFAGAVVRVRGLVAAGTTVDYADIRDGVLDAGALAVDLQIAVERPAIDREYVDADLQPLELLQAYLEVAAQHGVADADRLVERGRGYLERVLS